MIDGIGGTQVVKFDGRKASLHQLEYLDHDLTALGQELAPSPGRRLVIGPGGGVDILQGVRAGATNLTAVEINPLVVSVVNSDLLAFSGAPYRLPGVNVVVENGRTFLERSRSAWDLISLTWVDTGGSAVALAATEN
jgi:spermidine synthase